MARPLPAGDELARSVRRASLLLAATGALARRGATARAQVDPMRPSLGVYESQAGAEPVLVGEVFREGRDPARSVEHWVLSPDYVSPGAGVVLELRPGPRSYRDAHDFLARAGFPRGSRYVRVDHRDAAERPAAH